MMQDAILSGKSVLVTGATGHLGREMARALGRAGATVYVNARSRQTCEDLAQQLSADGLSAVAAAFDVTSAAEIDGFAARLDGPLHILVNNAYAGGGGTIKTATDDEFLNAYNISVGSAQRVVKACLPALRRAVAESGDASIVNVASMYGIVSPDLRNYPSPSGANPPFYGAAKAALIQYTRYAACEFGPEGIRVNAIAPGPFPSDKVVETSPQFVSRLAERVPLGRIGASREIGGPVVFLASSAATYVNGAVLPVDGGWTAW